MHFENLREFENAAEIVGITDEKHVFSDFDPLKARGCALSTNPLDNFMYKSISNTFLSESHPYPKALIEKTSYKKYRVKYEMSNRGFPWWVDV
jgi:hypothetical protein